MDASAQRSVWASGRDYEPYVGRWSRHVGREFVDWLAIPPGARWLDLGCGTVAGYVWDYAGKMELMRYFWDAAVALKPEDLERDEGRRFPICQPGPLRHLFERAGLKNLQVRSIDVPTHFRDFDDYWTPFLGGQFPAPDYAMSLDEAARAALRERIRAHLPIAADGSIPLIARAWAVRGTR